MDFKKLATLGLVGLLTTYLGIQTIISKPLTKKLETTNLSLYRLNQFCFEISDKVGIAAREQRTTPERFLHQKGNENILGVLNGPYFDVNEKTEGLVFLSEKYYFGTQKQEDIRGYFTINKTGSEIKVKEKLDNKINDYWLVIGTHPILVTDGTINKQVEEIRYNGIRSHRSAVGTSNGKNICFAVSYNKLTMYEFAKALVLNNYKGAINLDGNGESQLTIRDNDKIITYGQGTVDTSLVIFAYRK